MIYVFCFLALALPVTPVVERREVSYRRVVYTEIDLWEEPDSRPIFTFKLRPRLIQEGNGVKLICCVTGKPTPKVNQFSSYFQKKIEHSLLRLLRYNGLKNEPK